MLAMHLYCAWVSGGDRFREMTSPSGDTFQECVEVW